jgi:transcription elongation factor GreB
MRAGEDDEVILHAPGGSEALTVLEVQYRPIAVEPFQKPSEASIPPEKS